MVDPDAPAVGRVEPANGPEIFDGRLEGFDGASFLVRGGLVGGGVTGD